MVAEQTPQFRHDALFFARVEELADAAVPFAQEGLLEGDDVVVVCSPEGNRAVDERLRSPRVSYLDRDVVYQDPSVVLSSYRRLVHQRSPHAARVRVVAEPACVPGTQGWKDVAAFEAMSNQTLARLPLWAVCGYDTEALPSEVVAAGELTHPHVRRGGTRHQNPSYVGPAAFLSQPGVQPDPGTGDIVTTVSVLTGLGDLEPLRRRVRDRLMTTRPSGSALADDFLLAVNEVATNGLRHGRPPVVVRLSTSPGRVLCTVTDRGAGFSYPLRSADTATAGPPESRMGLRLVRRLVHDLRFSSGPEGFTAWLSLGTGPG